MRLRRSDLTISAGFQKQNTISSSTTWIMKHISGFSAESSDEGPHTHIYITTR